MQNNIQFFKTNLMKPLFNKHNIFALYFIMFITSIFAQHAIKDEWKAEKNRTYKSLLEPPSSNLQTLLGKYDVSFYKLDIAAERNTTTLSGNVLYKAKVTANQLDTFAFELKSNMIIDSVKINNQLLPLIRKVHEVRVPIILQLNKNQWFETQIYYHGTPSQGGFFSGIGTGSMGGKNMTWTLSEPSNAKDWWPAKQILEDKADSVYVFITTSSENKVGSNGKLANVSTLQNGKKRYEWKTYYPINYYLISFAISDYLEYNIYAHPQGFNDSILIQNYIPSQSYLNSYKSQIDATKNLVELYSDAFGLYPFWKEKYGHSVAPIGGGMEHQTMTTIANFGYELVAHELAHQWWGDNVTCATWNDIWINEGFATYSEYIAYEKTNNLVQAKNWLIETQQNASSSPSGSVFIPLTETLTDSRIFSGRLSYNKGACIIHGIRYVINNDFIFFKSLKDFQTEFKDSVATGEDFKYIVERNSGIQFDNYFNEWYYGEGYPNYTINCYVSTDSLKIQISHTGMVASTPLFTTPITLKLYTGTKDTIVRFAINSNNNTFTIPFHYNLINVEVDPNNDIIEKVSDINILGINKYANCLNAMVYPNPVIDEFTIELPLFKKYNVSVTNTAGMSVWHEEINNKYITINTDKWKQGVYLLNISDDKSNCIKKILKM